MARRGPLNEYFEWNGFMVLWTYPSLARVDEIAQENDIHPDLLHLTGWEPGGVQLFMAACPAHPRYRYRLKPRADCSRCKELWRIQNNE